MTKAAALAAALIAFPAVAAPPRDTPAGEQRFRELYEELVETNTTLSSGSCTLAAERMAARLKAAGFPESDLHAFAASGHEKEGGLVAVYPGRDTKLKAILLLAHIDVVEAKREDWTRDPFTLVEENGSFFARGAMDDKAEAAIWTDLLIRYRTENYQPRRTLKLHSLAAKRRRARSTARSGSRKTAVISSTRSSRSTRAPGESSTPTDSASHYRSKQARSFRRTTSSK
jgi:acetylornithine deacetylase/succinyl-diaminopimelate desuccinylase-like protein